MNQIKLGDYVKRTSTSHSDEYFMVTMLENGFKLRKVGSRSVVTVDSLEDYSKVDTKRDN